MTTLYEKSLNILQLPAVLDMLAAEAVSQPAKDAAKKLTPAEDVYEIRRRQSETTAAKDMMAVKGAPSFSGVKDVSASLSRARIGGMLNTRELLDIGGLLAAARAVCAYASGDRQYRSPIDYLFSSVRPNRALESRITESIIGEDELADNASRELAAIRRQMRIAGDRIRQSLQKIISSATYAKALQEPIITMRNDRYVVPVKAEFKSSVPGLVHDISSSGATLFVEPMSVVESNNEIRELLAKEKNEIERILMELSAEAASCEDDITSTFMALSALDLIFAKARLSYKLDCCAPVIAEDGVLNLRRARHPLLPVKTAVPIDVRLGGQFDTLVITGPNTGGKTVSIKTVGVLCAMAQCGLHIPAGDGSQTPVFSKILVDIGDEQSIEQSLSTFSSHMKNITGILQECGTGTLLLFDELGAGTDPVEGAALAISIIEYARKAGAMVAATTHYAELKIYATTQSGVQNAACEFDVDTLQPTYRLLIGIPGKSNAFAISARLGVPQVIIDDARSRIDAGTASFEEVLENLERIRQQTEHEREEAACALRRAEETRAAAEKEKQEADAALDKAAQTARREARRILDEARAAADDVFEELGRMRKNAAKENDWQRVNDARAALRRSINETEERLDALRDEEAAPPPAERPARQGDTVQILALGVKAVVTAVLPDGTLQLQAGAMNMTAGQDEVRVTKPERRAKQSASSVGVSSGALRESVRPELDLRGMNAEEAVSVLERYIDGAQMARLNTVTVIHGKGTGVLRAAVQQSLRKNRQVKAFRLGRFGEGENGVTVVELK